MKILQISDYHNKNFLSEDYFIKNARKTNPDLVVITGDIINSRCPDYDTIRKNLKEIIKLAPVYYCTGNHEARLDKFPEFILEMKEFGVKVLEDESETFRFNSVDINIIGLNDPAYYGKKHLIKKLNELVKNDKFNLLLCHRPELFEEYKKAGIDLSFAGHAHGGQVRLPIIGAIVAPNQGVFPKYAGGVYNENSSTMVVSYGIGSSLIPIRIFAKPELVLLEII